MSPGKLKGRPKYRSPGVYVEKVPTKVRPIRGVPTSTTAFIGPAREGPLHSPKTIHSFAGFKRVFGELWPDSTVGYAVRHFFQNGGRRAIVVRVPNNAGAEQYQGNEADQTGIFALEKVNHFNLLCILPFRGDTDVSRTTLRRALNYCRRRRALLLVDAPSTWRTKSEAVRGLEILGIRDSHAALYFPRVKVAAPRGKNGPGTFPPSGVIAGLYARTDRRRGVWKAPAGEEATLKGVEGLSAELTGGDVEQLNALGVNCLRLLPGVGAVVWGARTLGDLSSASEWKYIPVRRFMLFLEESLHRGTQWAVFEPNDEPLWARIRASVEAFLFKLFRQGAFAANLPNEAYFVKCDRETTSREDVKRGVVNFIVGFAPMRPREFATVQISQMAGRARSRES